MSGALIAPRMTMWPQDIQLHPLIPQRGKKPGTQLQPDGEDEE